MAYTRKILVVILSLLIGVSIAIGAMYAYANVRVTSTSGSSDNADGNFFSFKDAINRVAPSIVNVYTQSQVNNEVVNTYGSGIIVSPEGYVLTNLHVVANAQEIAINTNDGQVYKCQFVGSHPGTDLAVLRILTDDYSHIQPLYISTQTTPVMVGDVVIAIGNPLNLGQSATMGIVSAVGRQSSEHLGYLDLIQTDVALNTGNSGGALINTSGQLVGINSIVVNQAYGNQVTGLGFAIPAATALRIMNEIITKGKVELPYIGANFANDFGANHPAVIVNSVDPEGPLAQAGLQVGDRILSYNGQSINSDKLLFGKLNSAVPGEQVLLEVERPGEQLFTVTVVLGVAPTP